MSRHPSEGSALEWPGLASHGHLWDGWIAWHLDIFWLVWSKVDPVRNLGQAIAAHIAHGPPCDGQTHSIEQIRHPLNYFGQFLDSPGPMIVIDLENGADGAPTVKVIDLTDQEPEFLDMDNHPRVRVSVRSMSSWRWFGRVGHVVNVYRATNQVEVKFSDLDRGIFQVADLACAEPWQTDPGSLCPNGELQSLCTCEDPPK